MNIGYRLKLPSTDISENELFIKEYSSLFETCEIKVTRDFLDAEFAKSIISILQKYFNDNFSMHLPKNLLSGEKDDYEISKILVNLLNEKEISIKLIAHFNNATCDNSIFRYFEIILKTFEGKKQKLLIENVVCSNLYEYIKTLSDFFSFLSKKGISNFGFCFDIGHFLYSADKQNISQKDALSTICQNLILYHNIEEIHIHDFSTKLDHLKFGEGKMDFELFKNFMKKSSLDCRIIIENNVDIPEKDGVFQVEFLKRKKV